MSEGGADVHIGEIAHVFAATDGGPRSNEKLSAEQRRSYDNLILLCPNCHTFIDKAPSDYSASLLSEWKTSSKRMLAQLLGVVRLSTREEARSIIEPLLLSNKAIFQEYGPHNPYSENPEAEGARVWMQKMLGQIIPTNKELLLHIDINRHLLNEEEVDTVELFRQHVDDLVEKHIARSGMPAKRFPESLNRVFT